MTYQRNSIKRHGSARGARTILGVEALESRVLLAGLVNLSDNSLHSPSAQVDSVPAEIQRIETQLVGVSHVEINEAVSDDVDGSMFAESVWSPARDWLADSGEPTTEDESLDKHSCEESTAGHKEDCAKSDLVVNGGGSYSPDSNVTPSVNHDDACPPLVSEPAFIAVVVTPSSTQEIWPPRASATKIASSTFSRATIPTLPFHYFTPSSQLDHGQKFNLHSQPLADAAVRETFVAFSLLEASGVGQDLAKQTSIRETTSNTHARRAELAAPKQTDLNGSDHQAMIHKALAAIAQATEILQDTEATSVAHHAQEVLNDSWVDPSLISAIATTPSTPNRSSIGNLIGSQVFNNRVQLGLFSLVSIVLSLNSPIKLIGNMDAARRNGVREIRFRMFCRRDSAMRPSIVRSARGRDKGGAAFH